MFVAGTPVVRRQATTRMAIRIRGRRTTGAPTYLLHLTLQPGFESDPPELQAGTGKRQIEKACDCKPS